MPDIELAISIAMAVGYTWTQIFGATSYLVAGVAMLRMSRHLMEDQSGAAAEQTEMSIER